MTAPGLMFVSEAPWLHDDAAAAVLDGLLERLDRRRGDVDLETLISVRLPGERDPLPEELDEGAEELFARIKEREPLVIAPFGGLPAQLLTGRGAGINALRGRPHPVMFALVAYWIFPLFHPVWAVRTRSMRDTLRQDFDQLAGLLLEPRPVINPDEETEPEHEQLALQPGGTP